MAKPKQSPSKDRLFTDHEITKRVEVDHLGSWTMLNSGGGSSWWCTITAVSGRLIVVGDFDPVIFGVCSDLAPRKVVAWIGSCPADDGYYPAQKAEIGMHIMIAKTARANGINREAVFAALAAVRRLHALLTAEPKIDVTPVEVIITDPPARSSNGWF